MSLGGGQSGNLLDALNEFHARAIDALDDKKAIREAIEEARVGAARSPVLPDALAPLSAFLEAYVSGSYTEADADDVAWALAAVMYVASPWDLIPDYLPAGLRDDELAVSWVLEHIEPALVKYVEWEREAAKRKAFAANRTQIGRSVETVASKAVPRA